MCLQQTNRLTLLGSAKINPAVTMGFEIMIEIEAGGTSSKVNQLDEDGKVGTQIGGTGSFNAANVDAYFGDARRVAWYIDHKDLGRMTVGRYETAGVIQTVDLGGIGAGASPSFILLNGGFFIRGPTGQFYSTTWANIGDPSSAQGRAELVRFDSPSWNGFIFSSSIAEAGDYWGAMLRYANEFNGVRIAGGIGFEQVRDKVTPAAINVNYDPAARPDVDAWGGGLSLMHVATGLFIQGHYNWIKFAEGTSTDLAACTPSSGATCTSGYWGQTTAQKEDATHWLIQGGIAKNWFGYGNTALYAEYGRATGWGASTNPAGRDFAVTTLQPVVGVIDTDLTIWGIGLNQKFDAAATEIYLGYRNFNADITCRSTGVNCTGAGSAAGTVRQLQTEDFHAIVGGARVQF